jgi:DNA-binding NarL/FixJ family response regulator
MCINVIVANSCSLARSGIRLAIQSVAPEMAVVGEAVDGQGVLTCRSNHQGAVVMLLDMVFPDMAGLDVVRRLLETDPGERIILLNHHGDRKCAKEAIGLGVRGYLERASDCDEVLAAIRQVSSGRYYVSPVVKADAAEAGNVRRTEKRVARLASLTPREREILEYITEGLTNKDIAAKLDVSFSTVRVHRGHLMKKLGVHKIVDLVRCALREKWFKRDNVVAGSAIPRRAHVHTREEKDAGT